MLALVGGGGVDFDRAQQEQRRHCNHQSVRHSGMAIMSTHPRDYATVLRLALDLPQQGKLLESSRPVNVVPCLGVHPWFLHEIPNDDWTPEHCDDISSASAPTAIVPRWQRELEIALLRNPKAIVGEIGLDGFHFDPITKELVCPLVRQAEAFVLQLDLAARLDRPACVHCVRSFGLLMQVLSEARKRKALPPKLYFHAFGGKLGTVNQLLSICSGGVDVYFGFAPIVNFRSPKTADVIRRIGIDRLLLESDHEDAFLVGESLREAVRYYASALNLEEQDVVHATTRNAARFYGFQLEMMQEINGR
jgi:TatD DNase family protein